MAENPPANRRQCPTRADGVVPLIVHWIPPSTCLERQRGHYHKCYTCLYRGKGADEKLPVPPAQLVPQFVRAPARTVFPQAV